MLLLLNYGLIYRIILQFEWIITNGSYNLYLIDVD